MPPMNRRQFIGTAAGAIALSPLSSTLAQIPGATAGPRTVKLGLIGCGWWGMVVAKAALKAGGAEVIALCDVDQAPLERSAAELEGLQGRRPATHKLYEDLLKTPGLEAVVIATPTHWHALQFHAALASGMDIYCEKPLAYDLREGQAMVAAAARSDRVVQIGFQRRQSPAFRAVRQLIADGRIGRVVQADAQINYTAKPASPDPVAPPETLDWNLWCGPGPLIPYSPQVGHGNWRLEKTSGQGHLVDWGIHLIDAARYILGEGPVRAVTAAGGIYRLQGRITTPDSLLAHFEFERCPVTWRHRLWGAEELNPDTNYGLTFLGEQGTIFVNDSRWTIIPSGRNAEREVHEERADTTLDHVSEFLDAVRQRRPASSSTLEAHFTTSAVQLAMIAHETGSRLQWDAARGALNGPDAAQALLQREYRAPWRRPT